VEHFPSALHSLVQLGSPCGSASHLHLAALGYPRHQQSKSLLLPLSRSPPHFPRYNGAIERAQREIKTALRQFATAQFLAAAPEPCAAFAVHHLNHQPRRSLRGHTACEIFASANRNPRDYNRAQRKEILETLHELAEDNLRNSPVPTPIQRVAAWRHTVESWLQQQRILTIHPPKSVTPFPKKSVS
jgi:hypothetical protein